MNNYVGVKWGELDESTKKDLLEGALCINAVDCSGVEKGECIVDLLPNLSVQGFAEEEGIHIDDNAIMYDPEYGI